MNLAGLALRLAAVEALCPAAALAGEPGATFPTLAGPLVYDSYADIQPKLPTSGHVPIIAVFTEDASGERQGGKRSADGASPFVQETNLVFEVEVDIVRKDDNGEPELGLAATDPEAEAMLDLMGSQILRTLHLSPIFRKVIVSIDGWQATGLRESLGIRLARMQLRVMVSHFADDWRDAAPLPAPLSTVAAMLPAGSYGAGIIAMVQSTIVTPPAPTLLEVIRFGLSIGDPPDDVESAPIQGHADTDGVPDS